MGEIVWTCLDCGDEVDDDDFCEDRCPHCWFVWTAEQVDREKTDGKSEISGEDAAEVQSADSEGLESS